MLKHLHVLYFAKMYMCSDFSEKLFSQLEKTTERFEVKVMMMDLISRLIGIHQVSVLDLYGIC